MAATNLDRSARPCRDLVINDMDDGIARQDQVDETTLGLYWSGEARLLPWMRANVGLRGDVYWFDVDAVSQRENSGNDAEGIASPKVGVVFGPWASTEVYLTYGRGFHSNDARGTITYASCLENELTDERTREQCDLNSPRVGIEDQHFHPVEPRMLRGSITWRY